jgi:hypothetical protein
MGIYSCYIVTVENIVGYFLILNVEYVYHSGCMRLHDFFDPLT